MSGPSLGLWTAHILFILLAAVLPVVQLATRRVARSQILALTRADRPRLYRQQSTLLLAAGALSLLPLLLGAVEPDGYRLGLGRQAAAAWSWAGVLILWIGYRIFVVRLRRSLRLQRWMSSIASPEILALAPGQASELPDWGRLSLAAGLGEEIAFRGFLLWYLGGLLGAWPAVGVTAAIFAVVHAYQGRRFAVWIFAVGLLLGTIVLLADSLWPVVALHALNNFEAGRAYMVLKRARPAQADNTGPETV